jgi:hypothetical protein
MRVLARSQQLASVLIPSRRYTRRRLVFLAEPSRSLRWAHLKYPDRSFVTRPFRPPRERTDCPQKYFASIRKQAAQRQTSTYRITAQRGGVATIATDQLTRRITTGLLYQIPTSPRRKATAHPTSLRLYFRVVSSTSFEAPAPILETPSCSAHSSFRPVSSQPI